MPLTPNLSTSRAKERPTASYVTCLVGAIFPLYLGVAGLLWSWSSNQIILGAGALASGSVIALSGLMLYLKPEQHKVWSAATVISSLAYWTSYLWSSYASYLWSSGSQYEIFYLLFSFLFVSGLPYMMIAGILGYTWKPRNG